MISKSVTSLLLLYRKKNSLFLGILLLLGVCALQGAPSQAPEPAPDRTRFTFLDTTAGARHATPAYVTVTGRDASGRFCHLDPGGRFVPCTPADNTVPLKGRTWCAYSIPLQEATRIDIDRTLRVDSARAYLSVGGPLYLRVDESTGALVQPDPSNPSDPNVQVIYDWIEFALDAAGFHGNTTCVDQFGMPVTLTVLERGTPARTLGPVGIQESRSSVFKAWRATVPEPFRNLEEPQGRRILAPAHSPGYATGGCKDYFEASLASLWKRYASEPIVLTPDEGTFTGRVEADGRLVFTRAGDSARYAIGRRPTTTEVFLCSGVLAEGTPLEKVLGSQLAALLNRNVNDPLTWRSPAGYYRQPPFNEYARFWHQHSLEGKAYGFPYDDVNDQSPSLATPDPMEIQVAFRWD